MPSPGLLALLRETKRGIEPGWTDVGSYGGQSLDERGYYYGHLGVTVPLTGSFDVTRVFRAELPERRYYESIEREEAAIKDHGGKSQCPECGAWAVTRKDCYTLGYAGHPGAEISVYSHCGECDWGEL